MKANELRIGNLVNNPYDEPTNVDFNVLHHIGIIEINKQIQDYYKPIELTEEWLIKFGFEKIDNDIFLELGNYTNSRLLFLKHSGQLRLVDSNGKFLTHDKLKYVHQLQNLYFALTNEELKFK